MRTLQPRVRAVNIRFGRVVGPEVGDDFYQSFEWRALRNQVIAEAKGRCQWQGCGRSEGRMYADHIVEISDGGAALDRSNLWCLCHAHHNAKSADERAGREGQKIQGG